MKKKLLLFSILAIVISGASIIAYKLYFNSNDNIQSIYLVPKDAVYIFETETPIDNWAIISDSKIWQHLNTNSYFNSLAESLNKLDTIFKNQKGIFNTIGERSIIVSAHIYAPKKYSFLYIIDLQKIAKLNIIKNNINALVSEGFKVSKRNYHNHEITEVYNKESRDLQIVTQADLISNYTNIKSDLEKTKYASAIIELVLKFTLENDPHPRLFNGIFKILQKMDSESTTPMLQFVLFYKFFLEEIGYGIDSEQCVECSTELISSAEVNYNHEIGFMCGNCGKDHIVTYKLSSELFNKIICLSQRNKNCSYSEDELKSIITFFEKFLIYHVDEFKGLKSLQMY